MSGRTTLHLHSVATLAHIISGILLTQYAAQRDWLIANEFLTAFFHLIGFVLWYDYSRFKSNIESYKVTEYTRRWTEYAFTAGLLEVAILNTDNAGQILTILTLNALLQLMGYLLDAYDGLQGLLIVGFATLAAEVSLIALWSSEPAYTIAIYAVLYALFGVVQTLHKSGDLYYDEDHVYTVLSITTKLVLTWTLVAHDRNDSTLEISINTIGLIGLILAGFLLKPREGRLPRL